MGHQTGNLNGLNLGRQSAGYGDNHGHVGATENDYQYGVTNGYGYDGYGHSDIHHWGSQSGWGSDGWGDSKAWGRKGDKNGLSGLKGLKGFDGFGARGGFGHGFGKGRGGLSSQTLYGAGPDEYRGNEGDYIQGRHDVDDPSTLVTRDLTTVRRTTKISMMSTSVRTPPTPTTSLPTRLRVSTTSMILPVSATTTMVTVTPVRRTTALSMTYSTQRMLSSSTPTVATDSSPTPIAASTLPDSTLTLITRVLDATSVLDVALSARDTASATTATPTTTATPASPPPNSVDATTPTAARKTPSRPL